MATIEQRILDLKSKYSVIDIIDLDQYTPSSVDLYDRILSIHKQEYTNSEKIIFKITKDYYRSNYQCGVVLHGLQNMINEIDISNFFVCVVTTNDKIAEEYKWILDNISIDNIPFNLYTCDGEYQKTFTDNYKPFIKYEKLQDTSVLETLSLKEKQLLFESDTFCMIPWISLMISPDSSVRPCCESRETIGNCAENALADIWNSDNIKSIRKDMLLGKKIDSCKGCYLKESLGRDTLRKTINRRFANEIKIIDTTHDDGHLDTFQLKYLDSRFNNLCNLACRYCNPTDSSSWHESAVFLGLTDKKSKPFLIAGKNEFDIYNQIAEHSNSLDRIYFAGGEPLIIEQFYKIVQLLDQRGRHEVELIYNTNMTKSGLKNNSIFDLWKNFKKISIGASLDGEGIRGEYLRSNTKWNDVVDFRKEMIKQRPDIDFYISATTSIMNALHVPDFHRSWVTS